MPAICPVETSRTCSARGACPPAGSGRYCPNAGHPLAEVGTRREPRHPRGPGSSIKAPMFDAPLIHLAKDGIDWTASAWSNVNQLFDVVALEGVHVSLNQLGVGIVQLFRVHVLGQTAKRGACAEAHCSPPPRWCRDVRQPPAPAVAGPLTG